MIELKNAAAGAVLGGSLLFTAGVVMANAQPEEPPADPDGLVTVLVGGSTAQDSVPIEEAAAAAAQACGTDPAAALGLAQLADVEGAGQTVCQDVLIVQNTTEPAQAPAETDAESEAPAVPGEEEEAAPEDAAPAVPGEGQADMPFNSGG